MKNTWIWIAGGLVALLALGGGAAAALGRKKPQTILIVGDSHSEVAWTFGGILAQRLRAAGITTFLEGVPGASVWWWLQNDRLLELVQSVPLPDLVIVQLGGGDAARRPGQEQYSAELYEFVSILQGAGVREIIWLSPTKDEGAGGSDARRQEIANWQASRLPVLGVEVVSMRPFTDDLSTRDGIHYFPGEGGYSTWAGRVLDGPLEWLVQ
jgi:lysophospholipase L1-like esterase